MQPLGQLQPTGPYNLPLTLDLLQRYAHPSLDVAYQGAYWRLISLRGGLNLVRVRPAGEDKLAVDLMISTTPPDKDMLMKCIRHILGVEDDPRPFYAYAQGQPALWAVVEPLLGLRWLRTETVFEAVMLTITEQQITWTAAQRAQRWLVGWGKQTLTYDGQPFFAFPRAGQIASASVEDLRPLKITFRRMQLMIDIAQAIYDDALTLENLRHQSPEDAYDVLTAIKGIGHWTAAWAIQRSIGPHNYVGFNDVALQAAANRYFYGGEGKLTPEETAATFAAFGPYAGQAAHHTLMRWVMDQY
jgi:DNA-3-methyladenine glycosylase II